MRSVLAALYTAQNIHRSVSSMLCMYEYVFTVLAVYIEHNTEFWFGVDVILSVGNRSGSSVRHFQIMAYLGLLTSNFIDSKSAVTL